MNPNFQKLMTHTLTIRKRKRNWEGDFEDVETHTGINGFIQYGKKIVTDKKGEEVVASAIVFLRNDTPVEAEHPHWEIDQTAPYVREGLEVISIDPIDDPRMGKTHHYEVSVR